MLDTRRRIQKLIDFNFTVSSTAGVLKFTASFVLAWCGAFLPEYSGLSEMGVSTLFILLFAAALWVSEAIPAFSVSLLIIALEILLLGFHRFDFAAGGSEWKEYLAPWSSPLVFLFLAGFIMAAAASKTKLDMWFAKRVLFLVGNRPENVLSGMIAITFILSMFVSNTATTAMMMAVMVPIITGMKPDNPFRKGALLGVVIAANIGGMGTIIGTPPNAIAVGVLGEQAPSFIGWMVMAFPPALLMVIILRWILLRLYPSTEPTLNLEALKNVDDYDDSNTSFQPDSGVPSWKKMVVVVIFFSTVLLWLTGPIHHIPTTVVSLLPVVAFTIFGIIDVDDVRSLRWDVIILIIGGLSLGLAVAKTGLAAWFSGLIPLEGIPFALVILAFALIVVVVSNFMSNTAASNIILPLIMAVATSVAPEGTEVAVVAVALSASFAMMLPVSTPPNAIVYASGHIVSKDFLRIGLAAGFLGPLISMGWLYVYNALM